MEDASPARLYASALGALLLVIGIAGFFGAVEVDAWRNLLYAATGALGLLAASYGARPFALIAGLLYTVLAIRGFTLPNGEEVLDLFPSDQLEDCLRLAVGLLGLAAAAGTPRARLKARAHAAREGA
ncbi:MAG TPA: hypothetical protein VFB52_07320 [Solirubrobacterales bacterium]|nr:hypothetical protein [Solirubrobacterales bacterium]